MPQEIEDVFRQVKLSLFPEEEKDLGTECSCPDWSNPCKHMAAVYYLLGEEFDRDPFLLFKLRGRLGEGGRKGKAAKAADAPADAAPPEPLPVDAAGFWSGAPLPEDFFGEVRVASRHAALPKRLGSFPFWRGGEPFLEAMERIYQAAAGRGLQVFEQAGRE